MDRMDKLKIGDNVLVGERTNPADTWFDPVAVGEIGIVNELYEDDNNFVSVYLPTIAAKGFRYTQDIQIKYLSLVE